tara:strand:- start:938 stop:1252 length:315 start_codon:yes stop_codon:yes gene_type:complete
MKITNKDKNLSGALILLTLGFILYIIGSDGGFIIEGSMTLKDVTAHVFEFYLDIIIIFYIFLCLQIAGYLELKYRQDFLTVSIISILFTPFAVFFIYRKEDDDV